MNKNLSILELILLLSGIVSFVIGYSDLFLYIVLLISVVYKDRSHIVLLNLSQLTYICERSDIVGSSCSLDIVGSSCSLGIVGSSYSLNLYNSIQSTVQLAVKHTVLYNFYLTLLLYY